MESGDAAPMTPIGVNLPNDQEIRETYGSKSVSLSNVTEAYEKSTPREYRKEFAWSQEEVDRAEQWAAFAGELTTNLHEIIGHGSGQVSPALNGAPEKALKEHSSAIEEARADLVALYFVADPYLAAIGVVPAESQDDIVLAEYEAYARNALVQLRRIREGTQIEEDHMRNRQLIVHWLLANTSALTVSTRDGKNVLPRDEPSRIPRRRGAAARRSAANPRRRRLRRRQHACSTRTACTSTRRFATRSSRASTVWTWRPIRRS